MRSLFILLAATALGACSDRPLDGGTPDAAEIASAGDAASSPDAALLPCYRVCGRWDDCSASAENYVCNGDCVDNPTVYSCLAGCEPSADCPTLLACIVSCGF